MSRKMPPTMHIMPKLAQNTHARMYVPRRGCIAHGRTKNHGDRIIVSRISMLRKAISQPMPITLHSSSSFHCFVRMSLSSAAKASSVLPKDTNERASSSKVGLNNTSSLNLTGFFLLLLRVKEGPTILCKVALPCTATLI